MAGNPSIPGPIQASLEIQEEIMRRQRELLKAGTKEIQGTKQKLDLIKEIKPLLNKLNQGFLENFEKNPDKIKIYNSINMTIFIDLEKQRLMELTFEKEGKIKNVERREVKKEAQLAQVTQIIPAKDLSSQISWDMREKVKPSPQQEVKLKDSLIASATASQIKEPLPALIEKDVDKKSLSNIDNKKVKEMVDSLGNILPRASQLLQSELEKSFNKTRMKTVEKLEGEFSENPLKAAAKIASTMSPIAKVADTKEVLKAAWELATKPATESLKVLFGVYDAKMSTYEAYQTDINDKSAGLNYIKSFLAKGKTIDDMQKMTPKEFKDEKEFGKFNNALKFLGSNLKDENRIYNYVGDIASQLGMHDLAASGYDAAKNSVMLENVQHMKIMSVVTNMVESSTSGIGVVTLDAGAVIMQIGTPIWRGANALLSKLPEVKKAMQTLEASKVCFHSTNAKGLAGIVEEGKIAMGGTEFAGATEAVTKGVWTSVGKPMLNTLADYTFSFELKNAPALEKNAVKIWDLFGGRKFLTMGVKNDIALAENWTGRMFVANEQKAAEAINILKTAGMDMSKVQILVAEKTISDVAAKQVATRLTGETGWMIHNLAPAAMFSFANYQNFSYRR